MVRVWLEEGLTDNFRASIVGTLDIERPAEVVERSAASPQQACAVMSDWFERFIRAHDDGRD